jgi:hypothetical protein
MFTSTALSTSPTIPFGHSGPAATNDLDAVQAVMMARLPMTASAKSVGGTCISCAAAPQSTRQIRPDDVYPHPLTLPPRTPAQLPSDRRSGRPRARWSPAVSSMAIYNRCQNSRCRVPTSSTSRGGSCRHTRHRYQRYPRARYQAAVPGRARRPPRRLGHGGRHRHTCRDGPQARRPPPPRRRRLPLGARSGIRHRLGDGRDAVALRRAPVRSGRRSRRDR